MPPVRTQTERGHRFLFLGLLGLILEIAGFGAAVYAAPLWMPTDLQARLFVSSVSTVATIALGLLIGGVLLAGFILLYLGRHERAEDHARRMERARTIVLAAAILVTADFAYRIFLGLVFVDAWWLRWPVLSALAVGVAFLSGLALRTTLRGLAGPSFAPATAIAIALGVASALLPGLSESLAGSSVPALREDVGLLIGIRFAGVGVGYLSLILFTWVVFETRRLSLFGPGGPAAIPADPQRSRTT